MTSFLFVDSRKSGIGALKSGLGSYVTFVGELDCPEAAKMPFDKLNGIIDEANKIDSGIESAVRRIERTAQEIELNVHQLTVNCGGLSTKIDDYVGKFKWDRAAFPTTKSFDENWAAVQQKAQYWDKLCVAEASKYTELKAANTANEKNSTAGLTTRSLVDLLSPSVVNTTSSDPDFVATEHMQTILVVVPSNSSAEFTANIGSYGKTEKFTSTVVPGSWRKFAGIVDRDGNELWRVVIFKSGLDQITTDCRQRKWTVRTFDYSETAYQSSLNDQRQTAASLKEAKTKLANFISTAYGELVACWAHLKVMRLMADSHLRSGPAAPNRKFFVLKLKPTAKEAALRKYLQDLLVDKSAFGQDMMGDKVEGEDEYFPYASVAFQPQIAAN